MRINFDFRYNNFAHVSSTLSEEKAHLTCTALSSDLCLKNEVASRDKSSINLDSLLQLSG